ncbi:hypothetical protein O181_123561 [Austropuccinia psidii MF-1]|uniref:Tet-like 2OG-Fe(II) oxygenase domain-containing protein n=1 Tax=Austropuccinia psidii MF-1 TaxID=1389203 RepID=A0A9Q3KNP2_9BASI|nr:hypothetical protein [Austropuccinia psidii MF-1]
MPFTKKGNVRESAGLRKEIVSCLLNLSIYMLPNLCGTLIGPHRGTLALVGSDCANVMWAPTGESKDVCQINLLGHWAPFWTQSSLASNGRKQYLISCVLQPIVIPQPLRNSGRSQKTYERKTTRMNRFFSSSCPTAQISMPVSENMTPSEAWRVVDVNQIKRIHFGHVVLFSSTRLLVALVEFRPFTAMSEVKVNQWDELSQFLFREKRFTDPIATNGALLERFNYEGDIPVNQGACKFASALTFTMNGFKNSPHLDKDPSLYALGWWFQADKRTGQIQRDASNQCTGGKWIFPNEHFWIDLFACHGLIQLVWASSTFVHYTDPAQDNKSTTLVGMSAPYSRRLAKTICRKSHGYYEIGKKLGYPIRDGHKISCQFKE